MLTQYCNPAFLASLFALQITHATLSQQAANETSSLDGHGLLDGQQQILAFPGHDEPELWYLAHSAQLELKKRLSASAKIVIQGDEDFADVNSRYTNYKRPGYIAGVIVGEEKDVVETLNYARSRGIPFIARTGGHSLTTSLEKIQDALVIDMRGLNSIIYDAEMQQMTIGGGVTTGEFANATFSKGMEVSKYSLLFCMFANYLISQQRLDHARAPAFWASPLVPV